MFRVIVASTLSFAVLTAIFSGFLLAEQPAKANGETSGDAAFKPIVEAPLPDGFPTYTPVGEIEVKNISGGYGAIRGEQSVSAARYG
mgnify:CR=1 FL=1